MYISEPLISASNYDVVSMAGNLLIYTTPSFEALTIKVSLPLLNGMQYSVIASLMSKSFASMNAIIKGQNQ